MRLPEYPLEEVLRVLEVLLCVLEVLRPELTGVARETESRELLSIFFDGTG